MTNEQLTAACEAILFAAGEPLEVARIAEALEVELPQVQQAMQRLGDALDARGSGVCLLRLGAQYQLCSRTEYAQQVRTVLDIKKNTPLSPAAFEVLAVVAYNQPVTKAYVEQIRGVDCSGVISTLCQRGLLEEKGRLELPGRPLLYGTTPAFLRCFCLTSLADLPELPEKPPAQETDAEQIDSTQGVQVRSFFSAQETDAETESETEMN